MTYNKGIIVKGIVSGIESYGIFVHLDAYYSGLIHISEISKKFVRDPHHFVEIGDTIYAEIIDIDEETGHLKLSIKNINYREGKPLNHNTIIETKSGFTTLHKKLPFWISENIKNHKNEINSIDK